MSSGSRTWPTSSPSAPKPDGSTTMSSADVFWVLIAVLTALGGVGLVASLIALAKSGYSEH